SRNRRSRQLRRLCQCRRLSPLRHCSLQRLKRKTLSSSRSAPRVDCCRLRASAQTRLGEDSPLKQCQQEIATSRTIAVINNCDIRKIRINLLLFGACREAAGVSELRWEIDAPADVASAWSEVKRSYPNLEHFDRSVLFAVNEDHARAEHGLSDGDT